MSESQREHDEWLERETQKAGMRRIMEYIGNAKEFCDAIRRCIETGEPLEEKRAENVAGGQ